jgi:septum formation protein
VRLVLASASPRRAELLRSAGIDFDVRVANVDESLRPGETAEQHVARLAEEKAIRVLPQAGQRPVLGADTVVVVDGRILGKPADLADATRMLRLLSGRSHQVLTGVALVRGRISEPADQLRPRSGRLATRRAVLVRRSAFADRPGGPPKRHAKAEAGPYDSAVDVAVTTVEFAALTDAEIAAYVASGEAIDKAGAYAIQGLASRYVTRIDGSYSNVVGLPVAVVYELCKRAGLLIS